MSGYVVPFNRPYRTGHEGTRVAEAIAGGHWSGNGLFTQRCEQALTRMVGCQHALLTHSCTAALEMAALLLDLAPGDEIILPSYTFVTSASAFALRGAVPVFVDIRADSWNLDEQAIEAAITPRTRAIVAVHYAGVACEMDKILTIAAAHGLAVVEDAAQALGARYKGRPLGGIGTMGAVSFHATKNIVSGEGGALLVNDPVLGHRAEIVREKGTDRNQFLRGDVDKYSWRTLGSSYLPAEFIAAFLSAQLDAADSITRYRRDIWGRYHDALSKVAVEQYLHRPAIPEGCEHNGHIYAVELASHIDRASIIATMAKSGVQALSHYEPLHLSDAGQRLGRASGSLAVTERVAAQILRLPLWPDMPEAEQSIVVDALVNALDHAS
jgi:dTDP-4-amino-4,6-dideoxygalactose transaminase